MNARLQQRENPAARMEAKHSVRLGPAQFAKFAGNREKPTCRRSLAAACSRPLANTLEKRIGAGGSAGEPWATISFSVRFVLKEIPLSVAKKQPSAEGASAGRHL
jgi:hypothetical protein